MLRTFFLALGLLIFGTTSPLLANDTLKVFEPVIAANAQVQPGLENYFVKVETPRINDMMSRLTTGVPSGVKQPPTPVITKFWQRNGESVLYAEQIEQAPYVKKMMQQISGNLAVELNGMLLPQGKGDLRQKLVKSAEVKSTEVALANELIRQVEITFAKPTDLDGAFYVSGMRLPQKQVTALSFDIDTGTNTIREMIIKTASGLQLTVEIRYLAVTGGYIPERFQITSPDGKIDDRFEVSFMDVDGFKLPASMLRVIRRPELQEELQVFFKDYRVNQPITDEIRSRLTAQRQEK